MEEKLLIADAIESLRNIIDFETRSLGEISNIEIKNYIKVCREEDEGFIQELINLGKSKGYLEVPKNVDENELTNLKQNIL